MKRLAMVLAFLTAASAYGQEKKEAAFGFKKGMTLEQVRLIAPLTRVSPFLRWSARLMGCPPSSVLERARARALRAAGSPLASVRAGFEDSASTPGRGGNDARRPAEMVTSRQAGSRG